MPTDDPSSVLILVGILGLKYAVCPSVCFVRGPSLCDNVRLRSRERERESEREKGKKEISKWRNAAIWEIQPITGVRSIKTWPQSKTPSSRASEAPFTFKLRSWIIMRRLRTEQNALGGAQMCTFVKEELRGSRFTHYNFFAHYKVSNVQCTLTFCGCGFQQYST